jgi:hypothetical protein
LSLAVVAAVLQKLVVVAVEDLENPPKQLQAQLH